MSVATEHFYSQAQTNHVIGSRASKGLSAWILLGLVAVALCLLLAASTGSLWSLLFGPFFLAGAARLMGLRSPWPAESGDSVSRGQSHFGGLLRLSKKVESDGYEYQAAVEALESRILAGEPQLVVEELSAGIGNAGKKCAEHAYVIGRQYMRLGHYGEAREWLRSAGQKSKSFSILDELAETHLGVCNARLLAEGDDFFATGDYQRARERYARLSHGLGDREEKGLTTFLRSACVYCMLREYESARQSLLQALKLDQGTDDALTLLDLLQSLPKSGNVGTQPFGPGVQIEERLAGRAKDVMGRLRAR